MILLSDIPQRSMTDLKLDMHTHTSESIDHSPHTEGSGANDINSSLSRNQLTLRHCTAGVPQDDVTDGGAGGQDI